VNALRSQFNCSENYSENCGGLRGKFFVGALWFGWVNDFLCIIKTKIMIRRKRRTIFENKKDSL